MQDLANYYGQLDGPGYWRDRIDVVQEARERITPKWDCFECISSEYADALIDAGKVEDALGYLRDAMSRQRAAGDEPNDIPLSEA